MIENRDLKYFSHFVYAHLGHNRFGLPATGTNAKEIETMIQNLIPCLSGKRFSQILDGCHIRVHDRFTSCTN